MSGARYIATSRLQSGKLFLVAEGDSDIAVWDIESQVRISRFCSILDGFRLALAPDQQNCVAGSYRQGVALYNIGSGLEVWRRPDLGGLQFVQFSKGSQRIFCGFEKGPGQVLSADTGQTIRLWRGVRKLFESSYDNRILLYKGSRGCSITDSEQSVPDVTIPSLKPGPLLDAVFSPRDLCFSEQTAVRCFSQAGIESWRSNLSPDKRMIGLSYQSRLEAYFGILSDLASTETSIVKISGESGSYQVIASLGRLQQAGFCGDSKVVCTNGTLWCLETGKSIAQLWKDESKLESKSELPSGLNEFSVARNLEVSKLVTRLWGSNST